MLGMVAKKKDVKTTSKDSMATIQQRVLSPFTDNKHKKTNNPCHFWRAVPRLMRKQLGAFCTTNEDTRVSGLFICRTAVTRSIPSLLYALTLSGISVSLQHSLWTPEKCCDRGRRFGVQRNLCSSRLSPNLSRKLLGPWQHRWEDVLSLGSLQSWISRCSVI